MSPAIRQFYTAATTYTYNTYEMETRSLFRSMEILRLQYLHELQLTWLPKDARMPQPVRYKKQYQRTFRGRLFPPGGPKK